jgi:hypothetical protein
MAIGPMLIRLSETHGPCSPVSKTMICTRLASHHIPQLVEAIWRLPDPTSP